MASRQAFPGWTPFARLFSFRLVHRSSGPVRKFIHTDAVLLQQDDAGNGVENISVGDRNGFPVLTVPLPSRRELCEFTLRPLSETVKDLMDDIKDEDGGIDRVAVYNEDGVRISGSTRLDVLLRSNFKLVVNETAYSIQVPDDGKLTVEESRALAKTKTMIHQLYSSLNIEEHQLEKERKLLAKLDDIKLELEPMEKLKTDLNRKSAQRANMLVWGGLGYMALQFGFLARLTWWEYSWDIMEPVTYFVGYGTAIVCYAYFVLTRQEFLYPDARDRQQLLSFHKFSKKNQFDVEKYNHLKDCISKIEEDLQELRSPYKLHLPPRVTEKIKDH
ncbi:calcium uniporter protein, mitochondrial-like [Actinia tenebrosa]|uniref:Calcium uniporter protein n=1 Tax=Actinia tenebrosa TaxID=6105 RepID=A0A6P8I6M9_ACTTE|nr:calcium uniporter protein, mitochondrial-like [Actinia tenebrosa]